MRKVQNKFLREKIKNQDGILTLDFIFASVIVFGFSAILFAFAMTFSAIEVAQYVTFAGARAHFAAHKNEDEQVRIGMEKIDQLSKGSGAKLGFLFQNGWFEIKNPVIDDFNDEFPEDSADGAQTFIGARLTLIAHIMNFNIPIFGRTSNEEQDTKISSYLMREPTEEECVDFSRQRFQFIQQSRSGSFNNTNINASKYFTFIDGGC